MFWQRFDDLCLSSLRIISLATIGSSIPEAGMECGCCRIHSSSSVCDEPCRILISTQIVSNLENTDEAAQTLLRSVLSTMTLLNDIEFVNERLVVGSLTNAMHSLHESTVTICIFLREYLSSKVWSACRIAAFYHKEAH